MTNEIAARLEFLACACAYEWVLVSGDDANATWDGPLPDADHVWIVSEFGRDLSVDEAAHVKREFCTAYARCMARAS